MTFKNITKDLQIVNIDMNEKTNTSETNNLNNQNDDDYYLDLNICIPSNEISWKVSPLYSRFSRLH